VSAAAAPADVQNGCHCLRAEWQIESDAPAATNRTTTASVPDQVLHLLPHGLLAAVDNAAADVD
jgi:hypothetical protein